MTATTGASRTAHLLALMKKGDDAFNARDFATVDTVHHPDMIAYIPGLAEPVYGKEAHAAATYEDWTKPDLLKRAREIGIKGRSAMTKVELIKALRNH
jgi:hypothetical protein